MVPQSLLVLIRPSDSNSEKNNAKASIHVGAVLVNPSDSSKVKKAIRSSSGISGGKRINRSRSTSERKEPGIDDPSHSIKSGAITKY